MTDVFELRRLARALGDQYALLDNLKQTPARTRLSRKMKSTPGPMSPSPDQDWGLNLENELMRDTTDEDIPGGLRAMAIDALQYTTAQRHTTYLTGYLDQPAPSVYCAHLARHAGDIAEKFPAADDLADLLTQQLAYLKHAIDQRHGTPPTRPPRDDEAAGYGTAADLAPLVSAITGRDITRENIRYWARSGRITQHLTANGTAYYELAEVITAARDYTDNRKGGCISADEC